VTILKDCECCKNVAQGTICYDKGDLGSAFCRQLCQQVVVCTADMQSDQQRQWPWVLSGFACCTMCQWSVHEAIGHTWPLRGNMSEWMKEWMNEQSSYIVQVSRLPKWLGFRNLDQPSIEPRKQRQPLQHVVQLPWLRSRSSRAFRHLCWSPTDFPRHCQ